MAEIFCSNCNTRIVKKEESISSGYGIDKDDNKICYQCCALIDHAYMLDHGKIDLYLTFRDRKAIVTNWPGSLEFKAISWSKSTTNWGHQRIDVWFRFDNAIWWGYNIGDNEICRCKRTKRTRL